MTKWRKMNSAPRDGTPILVGKWIKDGQSEYPLVEYNYEPNANYRPSVRARKIQRKHP